MRRLLAAAPHPAALAAATDEFGQTVTHYAACGDKELRLLELLLANSPALAAAPTLVGDTPLHYAATCGSADAVRLLLHAAPSAAQLAAMPNAHGALPLHHAVRRGRPDIVQLLMQAAPGTVAALTHQHHSPLDYAFWLRSLLIDGPFARIARLLIAAPGQQPASLLQCLNRHVPESLPLFAEVAACYPLSACEWQLIPAPCPGLAAALPAVLERSEAEAALLVAHLPRAERCRLQTAALCLRYAQAVLCVALPQPLVWHILAACLL